MKQFTRTFFPVFGAAALIAILSTPVRAGDEPEFHWVDDAELGMLDLLYGDEPVLRYMYAFDTSTEERREETTKVYHHVFGPGTGTRITKGAGGQYPHHRGLFVGWKATKFDGKSIDTWHCKSGGGVHQRHVKLLEAAGKADSGTMTAEIVWNDADGTPVIREIRTVRASTVPGQTASSHAWQIDWSTKLFSQRSEIELDGDRQHAGFQFRAPQEVAEQESARYVRPDGFPQQQQAFEVGDAGDPPAHINLGWLAMTFPVEGQQYTVEYFEDPSLPKPSLYSERPYGRFGAFFRATLSPGEPLSMRYRLRVSSGEPPSRESIQKRYDAFVAELVNE